MKPRYNDLRYNDIPDITMKILYPGKSYSKTYGTERRYNDNPDITMWVCRTERKIVPDITILLAHSFQSANARYQ